MIEKISYYNYEKNTEVTAFTDGYAYDSTKDIHIISLLGADSSVRAISAALVSGKRLKIENLEVQGAAWFHFRIFTTKLSSALHQIVANEGFLDGSLLYIPSDEKPEMAVLAKLQREFALPALPEWADWIYSELKETGQIDEMQGTLCVKRIFMNEEAINKLVCEGVKNKTLKFPKGGKNGG